MKRTEIIKGNAAVADELTGADLLSPLVLNRASNSQEPASFGHVLVGNLVGFRDDGRIPLVIFPGMIGSAAHPSRSLIDLNRVHIGKDIVLIFENADPTRPIVVGVIRNGEDSPEQQPGHVEIEGDGERLILSAKHELVLRCGHCQHYLDAVG